MKVWSTIQRFTLAIVCVLASIPAFPADDYVARNSLKGVKGVFVGVDPLDLEAQKNGLTEDLLRKGLEQKLRSYGIKVLEKQDASAPAYLYADVTLNKASGAPFYVYSVTLSLKQLAYLKRDANIQLAAPTWALTRNGIAGEKVFSAAVHKAVLELGDKFCGAFKAVNPK